MDMRIECYDIQNSEFQSTENGRIFVSGCNGKINEIERKVKNYILFVEKSNRVVWKNDGITDKVWSLLTFFSGKSTDKIEIDNTWNILYHLEVQGPKDDHL